MKEVTEREDPGGTKKTVGFQVLLVIPGQVQANQRETPEKLNTSSLLVTATEQPQNHIPKYRGKICCRQELKCHKLCQRKVLAHCVQNTKEDRMVRYAK